MRTNTSITDDIIRIIRIPDGPIVMLVGGRYCVVLFGSSDPEGYNYNWRAYGDLDFPDLPEYKFPKETMFNTEFSLDEIEQAQELIKSGGKS